MLNDFKYKLLNNKNIRKIKIKIKILEQLEKKTQILLKTCFNKLVLVK